LIANAPEPPIKGGIVALQGEAVENPGLSGKRSTAQRAPKPWAQTSIPKVGDAKGGVVRSAGRFDAAGPCVDSGTQAG